jgi:hypothetical protein
MPASSRTFLKAVACALVALALAGRGFAADQAHQFRAGAATSKITPPLGVSINGGMQDHPALYIHDELHARCLVLDELANGYNGYLPTPAQHQLGGYETWRAKSSYLEVDASTKITAKLYELLGQLAAQP